MIKRVEKNAVRCSTLVCYVPLENKFYLNDYRKTNVDDVVVLAISHNTNLNNKKRFYYALEQLIKDIQNIDLIPFYCEQNDEHYYRLNDKSPFYAYKGSDDQIKKISRSIKINKLKELIHE